MTTPPTLILASGSPRRRDFLTMLGLQFTICTADIDESPQPNEPPIDLVRRLSLAKAQAVAHQYPQAVIIAADTIVVLGEQILGKPTHAEDAWQMLTQLRGRDHSVYSSVSLYRQATRQTFTQLKQTTVTMRPYADTEIEAYIASGDPMDKAGAYGIQNREFAPVASISGCYANVVGLPLGVLAMGLAQFAITLENMGSCCANFTQQPCCLLDQ